MPALMVWADIAVAAGGSTCWEAAFLELPNILLVLAENQAAVAASLHEAGCALSLGSASICGTDTVAHAIEALLDDPALRRQMSECGRKLVDGLGASRVVAAMSSENSGEI
jgi:UDP-2,4-diacetamido-2,4,6-trideoxy-beta-L-altropyranose hydrolase